MERSVLTKHNVCDGLHPLPSLSTRSRSSFTFDYRDIGPGDLAKSKNQCVATTDTTDDDDQYEDNKIIVRNSMAVSAGLRLLHSSHPTTPSCPAGHVKSPLYSSPATSDRPFLRDRLSPRLGRQRAGTSNLIEYSFTVEGRDACPGTILEIYEALPELTSHSQNVKAIVKNIIEVDTSRGGSLSNIYRGSMYSTTSNLNGQDVAVKSLRHLHGLSSQDIDRRITREATVASCLDHPNILPHYGLFKSSTNPSQLYLVSEWAPHGNALQYLSKNREDAPIIMEGVIFGLVYLHGGVILRDPDSGIVRLVRLRHLDLKPDNILVGHGPSALICDMGQAAEALAGGLAATNPGCVKYLSPELVRALIKGDGDIESRRSLYEKADVYAFGLTCYHLMTGQLPFPPHEGRMWVILAQSHEDPTAFLEEAPKYHRSLSPELFDLLQRCWSIDPEERPTMREFQKEYMMLPWSQRKVHVY